MKGFYSQHAVDLNAALKQALSPETRRSLHRKRPYRHIFIAFRQLILLFACPWIIFHYNQAWVWIPAAALQGFVIFSFSVLLHEVLHQSVFRTNRPRVSRWLGFFYGAISGLSSSQFTRWHLDHHDELGSETADPKRYFLSPRRNQRWFKLLYFTPVLFPIYFRAAARAQATYKPGLRKTIKIERSIVIGFHLNCLASCWVLSPEFAIRAYVIPVFFVFPVAFAVNRLGQHYVVNPENPANWSTLMAPNRFWNLLFLFSSYHLEHHYFPAVPFYNLPALHRELRPFYQTEGIRPYGYGALLSLWLIKNHRPHTNPNVT